MRLVEVSSPVPTEVWREVLAADPAATASQTPEWLAAVCATGPYRDAGRVYRFDDGRTVVLPMVRRGLLLEESWPFHWGGGGPLADGPVTDAHARAVYADLAARPAIRVTVRPGLFADAAWACVPAGFDVTEHLAQVVDLSGGFGAVWRRFRGQVRRDVHKAEAGHIEVEAGRESRLVGDFDELYRDAVGQWAERQREPLALARWRAHRANPRRKFEAVAERFGDRCTIWVARSAGQPAAALIVLRHGEHARYWRGAMNQSVASSGDANKLLQRLAIEAACESGCRSYSMGESRPGSGLAAFKTGFGAETYRAVSYRRDRLPVASCDAFLRTAVKRVIGFKDI